jgi:opacity protein-like surface antigen
MSYARGKMRLWAVMLISFACLIFSGAEQPALAGFNPTLHGKEGWINMAGWTVGFAALSVAAHYMYKNSPAERTKGYPEELGPGEWYVGAYTGLSYLPSADWNLFRFTNPAYQGKVAENVQYQPGIQGGLKFGRYFDWCPWFGIECENLVSRNNIRGNQGAISPPVIGGPAKLLANADWFIIWDMQVNLLARYGFFKDKEITFGRLQPYVGIGPGFEIMYGRTDSAKNFAYEALAGIRYMCTKDIGLFFEYKFSYQSAVEYEEVAINKNPSGLGQGTVQFDVPHHRFVIGVSYHFKNFYGN